MGSNAPCLFRISCQEVVRPGEGDEPLFGSAAHVGFVVDFYFHIYDHYLVFICFESVVEFFFNPFFSIIPT
jgi:hypothetical protein